MVDIKKKTGNCCLVKYDFRESIFHRLFFIYIHRNPAVFRSLILYFPTQLCEELINTVKLMDYNQYLSEVGAIQ